MSSRNHCNTHARHYQSYRAMLQHVRCLIDWTELWTNAMCLCVCVHPISVAYTRTNANRQSVPSIYVRTYNILSIVARLTLVAGVCLLLFVNLKSNWSFHAANTTYTCDINKLWMNTNGLSHVKRKCDFFMGLVGINSWRIFSKNVTREMLHFF